jgi:hypothetical protein
MIGLLIALLVSQVPVPAPAEATQSISRAEPAPIASAPISILATLLGIGASVAVVYDSQTGASAAAAIMAPVVVLPSAGRIAAGDSGGAAVHIVLRGAITALAMAWVSGSSYEREGGYMLAIEQGVLVGAALIGESIVDISTAPGTISGDRRKNLGFYLQPLAGTHLLPANAVVSTAPLAAHSPRAFWLPSFGLRAGVQIDRVALGIRYERSAQTVYPAYETRNVANYGTALDLYSQNALMELEWRPVQGSLSAGTLVGVGVNSMRTEQQSRSSTTGATSTDTRRDTAIAGRGGLFAEWTPIPRLGLRAEMTLDARSVRETAPSHARPSPGLALSPGAYAGLSFRL